MCVLEKQYDMLIWPDLLKEKKPSAKGLDITAGHVRQRGIPLLWGGYWKRFVLNRMSE